MIQYSQRYKKRSTVTFSMWNILLDNKSPVSFSTYTYVRYTARMWNNIISKQIKQIT